MGEKRNSHFNPRGGGGAKKTLLFFGPPPHLFFKPRKNSHGYPAVCAFLGPFNKFLILFQKLLTQKTRGGKRAPPKKNQKGLLYSFASISEGGEVSLLGKGYNKKKKGNQGRKGGQCFSYGGLFLLTYSVYISGHGRPKNPRARFLTTKRERGQFYRGDPGETVGGFHPRDLIWLFFFLWGKKVWKKTPQRAFLSGGFGKKNLKFYVFWEFP